MLKLVAAGLRRPPGPATLRAAFWTYRSLRRVTADLEAQPLACISVSPPPALPERAGRGVFAVLQRADPTCLQRSLVLQRWMASQGDPRAVIVGVRGARDFKAHAWLDGETPPPAEGFSELTRISP